MPMIFQYLLKLTISLAIMYSFYQLILRRLTFYNYNRWYLAGYSLLCFFISLINITPVLEGNAAEQFTMVQYIPTVGTLTTKLSARTGWLETMGDWTVWNWSLIVLIVGGLFMFTRLIMQLISFARIRRRATLIADDDIRFYQVDKDIMPFSFGNSIFINQELHTEDELKKIIRHEFVHVKQKHTVDIIWSEILCILNWYNPFAWLIKKAIRQNLEFIADNKVIQGGMDKKQYQYLLLKVVGNTHFSIASNFNFSSLKKRIAMMNKMKSARIQLVKFLFILPLLAVLLLAFRDKLDKSHTEDAMWLTGIVLDQETQQPIGGMKVSEASYGVETVTDENGFYKLAITGKKAAELAVVFAPAGTMVKPFTFRKTMSGQNVSDVSFLYVSHGANGETYHTHSQGMGGEADYSTTLKLLKARIKQEDLDKRIDKIVGESRAPIWIIDGQPYAIINGGKAWFDKSEFETVTDFKVRVDGKLMSMDEANKTIDRYEVVGIGAMTRAQAIQKFDINENLFILTTKKGVTESLATNDTIPASAKGNEWKPEPTKSEADFLNRHPLIKRLTWAYITSSTSPDELGKSGDAILQIHFKNGNWDMYNVNQEDGIAKFKKNYGEAPPLAPPPPTTPSVKVEGRKIDDELRLNGVALQGHSTRVKKVVVDGKMFLTDSTNTQPLYIVDGKEISGLQLSDLDPNTIESISVLKDAAAVLKYGVKAANGVIIIVTKKNPLITNVEIKADSLIWNGDDKTLRLKGNASYTDLKTETTIAADVMTITETPMKPIKTVEGKPINPKLKEVVVEGYPTKKTN